jgi:dihydroflavonol-4-reductase
MPGRLATEADAEPWPPAAWRPLYAQVKTAMEHEALRAFRDGLPVVIVNPSVCIGEYDAHKFSGQAVLAFARTRLPFYMDHTMNVVYTGDVGVGHVRAAERGRVGERYLLAGRNIALKDFAAIVARAAGARPPRWRLPYPVALTAAFASELAAWVTRTQPLLPRAAVHSTARQGPGLDAAKALSELGLPQTPVEEAVERAVGWFRAHGIIRS